MFWIKIHFRNILVCIWGSKGWLYYIHNSLKCDLLLVNFISYALLQLLCLTRLIFFFRVNWSYDKLRWKLISASLFFFVFFFEMRFWYFFITIYVYIHAIKVNVSKSLFMRKMTEWRVELRPFGRYARILTTRLQYLLMIIIKHFFYYWINIETAMSSSIFYWTISSVSLYYPLFEAVFILNVRYASKHEILKKENYYGFDYTFKMNYDTFVVSWHSATYPVLLFATIFPALLHP